MIKHYEQIWEEAEETVSSYADNCGKFTPFNDTLELLNELASYDDSLSEEREKCMGRILLNLCYFSKLYDINTYTALKNAMDDMKVDLFDPEINIE